MGITSPDGDEAAILARLDRSSPERLLTSLACEMARLGREVAALRAQLAAFESVVAVADRIAASQEDGICAPYPQTFTIGAAHPSLGAPHFYGLEYGHANIPTRWTGPERQFSFTFFMDRSRDAHFRLEFESVYFSEPAERLLCLADGQDIAVSIVKSANGLAAVGALPARRDGGGSVLTFVCPSTTSPSEKGLPDTRKLGLLFQRLTVEAHPLQAGAGGAWGEA